VLQIRRLRDNGKGLILRKRKGKLEKGLAKAEPGSVSGVKIRVPTGKRIKSDTKGCQLPRLSTKSAKKGDPLHSGTPKIPSAPVATG
jgi:hypothetical protein